MRLLSTTLLPALLILLSSGASAGSAEDSELTGAVDLLRLLRDPEHPPIEELAPELAERTRAQVPSLYDFLADGELPDLGLGSQILSIYQRELILQAVEIHGRGPTLAQLGERLDVVPDEARRLASLNVWGAIAAVNDLDRVFAVALDDEAQLSSRASDALRDAVARMLKREPRGFGRLEGGWTAHPRSLLPALVRAVGDTRNPAGLGFLSKVVLWGDEHAGLAAMQIQKLGAGSDTTINKELALRMRSALGGDDDARSRALCQALTALGDLGALPAFIELLSSEDPGLRTTALWGLRKLTGLPFDGDPKRWDHWYRNEQDWMRRGRVGAFRSLNSSDAGEVRRSLTEISRHPLAREDFVIALGTLLESPIPAMRRMACESAAALGDRRVLPALLGVFGDDSPAVAEEAWRAASSISGLELPRDAALWRAELRRLAG